MLRRPSCRPNHRVFSPPSPFRPCPSSVRLSRLRRCGTLLHCAVSSCVLRRPIDSSSSSQAAGPPLTAGRFVAALAAAATQADYCGWLSAGTLVPFLLPTSAFLLAAL
eukprot:GHVT01013281.1.p8 GENE.GHVT01013281.1~~GHVT01013281.1.p8  ORF type:complete len:108 (-),score=34.06 GHVT01013281.1:1031-1354(-)